MGQRILFISFKYAVFIVPSVIMRHISVFLYLLALTIGVNNLFDVLWTELVLGLHLLKLLAGINEKDVVILLATFLQYQDTGRDACAIENVRRQTDDCIHIVLLFNEER